MDRYAYYPGCSPKSSTAEADLSARTLAEKLEIELVELESVACCGSREMRMSNPRLSLILNARTLALAEKESLDIVTICNTCYLNLQEDNLKLRSNINLLREVNNVLEKNNLAYRGTVKVHHLLWVLNNLYGIEAMKKKIKNNLNGLKVAPFYGCHLLRPYEVLRFDDPYHPISLRKLITGLGGTYIEFKSNSKCCGFHVLMTNDNLASRMSGTFIKEAIDNGAECMVTPCPLCHVTLDAYQRQAEKEIGKKLDLPIFHLQQLIGIALGLMEKELGLSKHMVPVKKVVSRIVS